MSTNELLFGRHSLARVGNAALLAPHGNMDGAEARSIVQAVEAWYGPGEPCFLLFDGKDLASLSPDGRKAFVQWIQRRSAAEYVAYYNIGFAVSTLLFLMQNAARLFGRTPETRTFPTEAEARAWLASLGARFES